MSYECKEAGIIVRTDALIGERPIVGWVLDNLEAHLGTWYGAIPRAHLDLTLLLCCINSSVS